MSTSSTERASETRPHGAADQAVSAARAAVSALVAVVALLALPQVAAAKYGSPLVAHVTTAGGRGGVYLTLRADHGASARETRVAAVSGSHAGQAAPSPGERRTSAGLRSHSDLGNGVVFARSARPVQQIVVAPSELVTAERASRFAAPTSSRADEFQHAAGQAHRLRGPPSLRA